MARRLITQDLIEEVRSILDEDSSYALEDSDIISALNRSQDQAASILSRHYPEPLLTNYTINAPVTSEYDLPEDCLEDKLVKIEAEYLPGYYAEVTRISYRDITPYESVPYNSSYRPLFYVVKGRTFELVPNFTSAVSLRIWYLQDPLPLTKSQGQIQKIGSAGNSIWLDSAGADLTTLMDEKNSYVNIIDGETGKRKGSMQILSIDDKLITFRSTPERSTVNGLAISSDITTLSAQPDDYICTIHGTCIPFRKKPVSNFLINYAIADLTRKLGDGSPELAFQVAEGFRAEVERMWAGQEVTLRIKDQRQGRRRRIRIR